MTEERITRAEVNAVKRELIESSILVTIDVASEILSVSKTTVKRIVDEGRLVPYDRHNAFTQGSRFRMVDLHKYVLSIKVSS